MREKKIKENRMEKKEGKEVIVVMVVEADRWCIPFLFLFLIFFVTSSSNYY